jgi:hypothetical protein
MDEKTKILEENVKNNDSFKKEAVEKAKTANREAILKKIAVAGGGAILGGIIMGFTSSENHPTTEGENTHGQPHQSTEEPVVVIHDEAPVADNVTEDMSFSDAFAIARAEVGPGGVFHWHGKWYGTYTKAEWDSMDADDIAKYNQSISHLPALEPYHPDPKPEIIHNIDAEVLMKEEDVTLTDGQVVHLAHFKQGNEVITKVDVDGDGEYDYILDIESGQAIGLNGNDDTEMHFDSNNNPTPEPIGDPIIKYDEIGGYPARLEKYSDGHQEIYIDGDGDGEYDNASIIIDTDGTATAYLYDENGNIIDQQVINSNSFPNDDIIPDPSPDNEPYIINSTVVSEDGHNGLANYYSDGSVEIKLDIDGDGQYDDGRVFMSAEGEISYYDADDNLITTPEYPEYDFTNIDSNNDIADNSNFGDDFNNNIDTNDWSSPV